MFRILLTLLVLVSTLLPAPGCTRQQPTSPTTSTPPTAPTTPTVTLPSGTDLVFETIAIAQSGYGPVKVSTQIQLMTSSQLPTTEVSEWFPPLDSKFTSELLAIDFSKYFVIMAFMGSIAVTGPKITVEKIWQAGNTIYVLANFKGGGPTSAPMSSSPGHIVKVSKANMTQFGEITFKLLDQWGKERATTTHEIAN